MKMRQWEIPSASSEAQVRSDGKLGQGVVAPRVTALQVTNLSRESVMQGPLPKECYLPSTCKSPIWLVAKLLSRRTTRHQRKLLILPKWGAKPSGAG
jgi:hypothetical protein